MTLHVAFPPRGNPAESAAKGLAESARWGFGPSGANVANGGTWAHLWIDPDRISLKKFDHRVGLLKSGKRFSRFEPHSQITLNFSPNLRVFYSFRRKGGERVINDITSRTLGMGTDKLLTPYLLDRLAGFVSDPPSADYRRGGRMGYGLHLNAWLWQRIAFPLLREAPHWDAVTGMAPALRQRTLEDFVRVAFGRRYRKDLVKAIAGSPNLNGAWLANELQTTFPIDWLIPMIPDIRIPSEDMRGMKKFMRWLPEYSARRLLVDLTGSREATLAGGRDPWVIPDTFRSWDRILQEKPDYTLGDYRITNWRDMHDHLAREFDKIGREDRPIEPTKIAKKLDGKSLNGLTLVHPTSTHELIDWGKEMHNCIGGYDRSATAGQSILFAVLHGDKMIGNLELSPKGDLRQLVGDYNRALPDPLRDTVYELVGKPIPESFTNDNDFPF